MNILQLTPNSTRVILESGALEMWLARRSRPATNRDGISNIPRELFRLSQSLVRTQFPGELGAK